MNGTRLAVETQAGIIPIEIGENGQIIMTQIEPVFGPVIKSPLVADAFCLSADDIIHPPQVVSTGLPFTVAILRDHDALSWAVLKPAALLKLQAQIDMPNTDVMEPFLVTLSGATAAGDTYTRLLLVAPMPEEDPFTGSATGAMASYIWPKGLIKKQNFIAEQGHGLGRPGQVIVPVLGPPQAISGVRVAGEAHVTMSGQLNL